MFHQDIMLEKLIFDINKALENDLLFVALSAALTLPDICGRVAYPDIKGTKERYIKWYDEHIGKYEKSPDHTDNMAYLSGALVYQLRCSVLHSGDTDFENKCFVDAKDAKNSFIIQNFTLVTSSYKNDKYILGAGNCISKTDDNIYNDYQINIRYLAYKLSKYAEVYYKNNKLIFTNNFTILNWEEVTRFIKYRNEDNKNNDK